MSAQRSLPSARATLLVCSLALALTAACRRAPTDAVDFLTEKSADGSRVATVRISPCGDGWCQSLWVGRADQPLAHIVTLNKNNERVDEIAWKPDGSRVAFLVNGYHLRLYDPETRSPAGLVDIVPNDATPTTRIARGLTFSGNGAALTFDDCPRDKSGCRPGMLAIR